MVTISPTINDLFDNKCFSREQTDTLHHFMIYCGGAELLSLGATHNVKLCLYPSVRTFSVTIQLFWDFPELVDPHINTF